MAKNKRTVVVQDSMQDYYEYACTEPMGKNFDPGFTPDYTPKQMLEMGVFGGVYMRDCRDEFPADWFENARLATARKDCKLNFFGVNASQSLKEWRRKDWIYPEDPRGWFQWYCRYYMGRRIPGEDKRQIKRWRAIRRHLSQVQNNCLPDDFSCRTRQRQALLHWAYDTTK